MDPERDNIGRHPRARRVGGARKHDENSDVRLSKTLSFILRHGAAKVGLQLGSDGFLYVDDILALPQCRAYTTADVLRVVENNNKQRYAVRSHPADGKLQIRANQGHSLQVTDLDLTLLTTDDPLPQNAIHGTYLRHWPSIKSCGLSRMSRIHIHMTTHLPTEEEVVSGIRKDCEVAVFIDLPKALSDGLKFYSSANGVILTPGDGDGFLPPRYFQKVLQLKPNRCLLPLD